MTAIPQFEVVPPTPKPDQFMKNFLDRVFVPVETGDWVVERINMHPDDFAELQKHVKGDTLDLNAVPELIATGLRAHLWNASLYVLPEYRKHHYEVVYGDLKLKNTVCLKKNETTREDCPDLQCLVDLVHDY